MIGQLSCPPHCSLVFSLMTRIQHAIYQFAPGFDKRFTATLYVIVTLCLTLQTQPGQSQDTRLIAGDAAKDGILVFDGDTGAFLDGGQRRRWGRCCRLFPQRHRLGRRQWHNSLRAAWH